MSQGSFRKAALRETALFLGLLFVGLVLLPVAIFWIGPRLLGDFGGYGFADFFGSMAARIRDGDAAAWFLVLSPYLGVQALRLTWLAWRSTRPAAR
ncbi:MAG: hypothetical protein QNJ23_08405 [Woeseiaceae bacterium]|nr:hypothetical protein [Woeseiaceae bacterium]